MMSAPALNTASTSSPRRAKSADKMDGAIQGCMAASVLHDAAPLVDELVRFNDLLGPLLGMLQHGFRQAVGFELVGVMATQLAPIGLADFLIAHAGGDFEHFV